MKTIQNISVETNTKFIFREEGEGPPILYVSDTGFNSEVADAAEGVLLDDTTTRIELACRALNIDPVLALGIQTPLEVAFVILTALSANKAVVSNSIFSENSKSLVGFNCAPRTGAAQKSAKAEYLRRFTLNGHEFCGYGKDIIAWIAALSGEIQLQVSKVIAYHDIEDTSKGSQFRSLEYLLPFLADLYKADNNPEKLALIEKSLHIESEIIEAKPCPKAFFIAPDEYLNNRIVVHKDCWEGFDFGLDFEISEGVSARKIKSITDIEEGEIGIWESSNRLPGGLLVLDIAYKRDVTARDSNYKKAVELAKGLSARYNSADDVTEIFEN